MTINLQAKREQGLPESSRQAVEHLERHSLPICSQIAIEASSRGKPQTGLTDSEERRKGMVGATGIEPMTSTVSR